MKITARVKAHFDKIFSPSQERMDSVIESLRQERYETVCLIRSSAGKCAISGLVHPKKH